MLDRLILHIGATKTGTSAVQTALARNRATLLANGLFYPANVSDEKAKAGRVTGGNGRLFRVLSHKWEESPAKALAKFEADLRALISRNKADATLFSHERAAGLDPKLLSELKAIFSRYFERVQVIYYVRHLTDHAISQYGEYVKRRKMHVSFDDFAPKYRARFKDAIEHYESVFGASNIQYVLYDEVKKNLYRDFLRRIGLPPDLEQEEPERVNRSLNADEIEILRHVNRMGLSRVFVAHIVEDFTFHNKDQKSRHIDVSPASIDVIAEHNRDVIECVNARLQPPGELRAASPAVLEQASRSTERENAELNPWIMRGLLESGLRVVESRKGKLSADKMATLSESQSTLRAIADQKNGIDSGTMLGALESGLRAIQSARADAGASNGAEIEPKADALQRKRQKKRERKKKAVGSKTPVGREEKRRKKEQKRQKKLEREKRKEAGAKTSA